VPYTGNKNATLNTSPAANNVRAASINYADNKGAVELSLEMVGAG